MVGSQSDKTPHVEECKLEARCGGLEREWVDRARKTCINLRENIRERKAQYDQELADLLYELKDHQGPDWSLMIGS